MLCNARDDGSAAVKDVRLAHAYIEKNKGKAVQWNGKRRSVWTAPKSEAKLAQPVDKAIDCY